MTYDSSTVMQETELDMVIKFFRAKKFMRFRVQLKGCVCDEVRFLYGHTQSLSECTH